MVSPRPCKVPDSSQPSLWLVFGSVVGETLAARIAMGALPIDETLDIGKHIADMIELCATNPQKLIDHPFQGADRRRVRHRCGNGQAVAGLLKNLFDVWLAPPIVHFVLLDEIRPPARRIVVGLATGGGDDRLAKLRGAVDGDHVEPRRGIRRNEPLLLPCECFSVRHRRFSAGSWC